jgi:DNA-binding NarL/FixJ family response regulator
MRVDDSSNHEVQQAITVMAVDDHPIFLDGIASVLTADPGIALVAQASSGAQALALYRTLQPDVTLMDIQMPDMDGIEATTAILREFPQARIIVLTTFEGYGFVMNAIKAGAFAYILKSSLRADLLALVRSVHRGQRSVALNMAMENSCAPDDRLTARELEVLKLVAQGQSNKRVGLTLAISEETVKTHMKSILPKLGANDRAHAVALALRRGVLPPVGGSG